jgi:hypothetical protein
MSPLPISIGRILSGGSRKTLEFALNKHRKPCLHIHSGMKDAGKRLMQFVVDNGIKTLNLAGPRASKEPGLRDFVKDLLTFRVQEARAGAFAASPSRDILADTSAYQLRVGD